MSQILVLIGSSAESPYLEIEEFGQKPTFAQDTSEVVFRWAEGDPVKRRRPMARFVNSLVFSHQRIGKRKVIEVRPFALSRSRVIGRLAESTSGMFGRDFRNLVIRVDWSAYQLRSRLVSALVRLASPMLVWRGNSSSTERRYRLKAPSSYYLSPLRLIEKLEIFLSHSSCQYMLGTTSTCYVNTAALVKEVGRMPSTGVYGGTILESEGIEFAAGNNVILSRDVAHSVLAIRRRLRHDLPDDVALGKLVSELGIDPIVRLDAEETPIGQFAETGLSANWKGKPVIRCKVSQRTRNSEEVILRLHKIHSLLRAT